MQKTSMFFKIVLAKEKYKRGWAGSPRSYIEMALAYNMLYAHSIVLQSLIYIYIFRVLHYIVSMHMTTYEQNNIGNS